jgi:hypothetical protein
MCTKTKISVSDTSSDEVIKTAVQADASTQKATQTNRSGNRGVVSDNIKTTNNGLEDDISTSKKRLLGE